MDIVFGIIGRELVSNAGHSVKHYAYILRSVLADKHPMYKAIPRGIL